MSADHHADPNGNAPTCGRVIAYVSWRGGSGKTTLTTLSAAALAEQLPDRKVVLIDAYGGQAPSSAISVMRAAHPNPHDTSAAPSAAELLDTLQRAPGCGLDVLPSPVGGLARRSFEGSVAAYRQVVEELRSTHDFVVIDAPVACAMDESFYTDFLLPEVDELIAVVTPHTESVQNTGEWLDVLTGEWAEGAPENDAAIDADKVWVAINQAEHGIGWDEPDIRRELSNRRVAGSVPRSDDVLRASARPQMTVEDLAVRGGILSVLCQVIGEPELETPDLRRGGLRRVGLLRRALQRA